jgi:hypothetical protein
VQLLKSLMTFKNKSQTGLVMSLALLAANARAEWRNSLKPPGPPAVRLLTVQDGAPMVGILCTENPTPQDKEAALELQKWIREITGATLPINFGNGHGKQILIRTDGSLGDEGYSISSKQGLILLRGGKTRGVINAVFALLEEDVGCRFYTDDSILLPKTNTLVLAPVERSYIPQLRLRDPFYACAFDPAWSLRNRTSAPGAEVPENCGGHMDYDHMFVHTAASIVPADKYFKTHPEYFAQKADGTRTTDQLCATDPGVARLAIDYVRQVLTNNPHTEIVSVSKNDNLTICHCERCTKLREAEGSEMANQLFLVNQVAEAVEKEFPTVTIDTLAYLGTMPVPKTVRPRGNVAIRLCNDTVGAWTHPFTPAEQCEVAKLLGAWSAVHHRIYIWDYNVNFSHYLAPMPNLDVMAANIRFWTTNHAEGVMLEGGYQGPAEGDELKCWVASKLLWNPAWDEKALTQDFIRGHYGKAAPVMEEYQTLLENLRTEHAAQMSAPAGGIRYRMDAPFITKDFVERATSIFARAKALANRDRVLVQRIERAELPILYVQCVRGPEFTGDGYARVVRDFERTARREHVKCLREGSPDFEAKLGQFKSRIPVSADSTSK